MGNDAKRNSDMAKRLLVNYFKFVFRGAEIPWDSDYQAELEGCVDCIIDAAVAKATEANDEAR